MIKPKLVKSFLTNTYYMYDVRYDLMQDVCKLLKRKTKDIQFDNQYNMYYIKGTTNNQKLKMNNLIMLLNDLENCYMEAN